MLPYNIMFIVWIALGAIAAVAAILLTLFVFSKPRVYCEKPNIGFAQDDPSIADNLEHCGIVDENGNSVLYIRSRNVDDKRTVVVVPFRNDKRGKATMHRFNGLSGMKVVFKGKVEAAYVELVEGAPSKAQKRMYSGYTVGKIIGNAAIIGVLAIATLVCFANAFEVTASHSWHMAGELPGFVYFMFGFLTYAPMYAILGILLAFVLGAGLYALPMFLFRGKGEKGGN
ncbi:MAG: ABC transporter permease [Bacilli bacterium]|nr:ABC transporter permease [Bacilli bacterium]